MKYLKLSIGIFGVTIYFIFHAFSAQNTVFKKKKTVATLTNTGCVNHYF